MSCERIQISLDSLIGQLRPGMNPFSERKSTMDHELHL